MKPTTTNQLARAIAPYVATILSVSLAVTLRVEHSCSNGPVRATEPTSPGVMTGAEELQRDVGLPAQMASWQSVSDGRRREFPATPEPSRTLR